MTPLVSVLLPVHNGMPYLPETVQSLFAQTARDFEVVAVDDGSTDDTPAYLKGLPDPRVRYLRLEKVGLVAALNHGLAAARGGLIARLDADDLATPDRLARQVEQFQELPGLALLGCDFDEIDPAGAVIGENDLNAADDPALRWLLHFAATFPHPGVMFPRRLALDLGGYARTYDVAEDYELFVRLAARGRLASVPAKLLSKRMHPRAVSIVHRERGLDQSAEIAVAYAAAALPGMVADGARAVYQFFNRPFTTDVRPAQLVRAFAALTAEYTARYRPAAGSELAQAMGYVRQQTAYKALRRAARSRRRPAAMVGWQRAAAALCPERFSLPRLALRAARLGPRDPLPVRISDAAAG